MFLNMMFGGSYSGQQVTLTHDQFQTIQASSIDGSCYTYANATVGGNSTGAIVINDQNEF
jgi:hypothetical protein